MRKEQAALILCVWKTLIGTMNGLMWMPNQSTMAVDFKLHGNKLTRPLVHPKCIMVAISLGQPTAMRLILIEPIIGGGLEDFFLFLTLFVI